MTVIRIRALMLNALEIRGERGENDKQWLL